jgi:hypothetical protein
MDVSIDEKGIEMQNKIDSIVDGIGYHIAKGVMETMQLMHDADPDRDFDEVFIETQNLIIGAMPRAMEKAYDNVLNELDS